LLCAALLVASPRPSIAKTADAPLRIAVIGDSLSAGYQLAAGDGFTDQLQVWLGKKGINATVLNAAVSGDTTSGGRARLDWALAETPDLVILELGANDMLRGIRPSVTGENLAAMIAALKRRQIPLLLAGMLAAPNLGRDYEAEFNAIYPRLAKQYGVPLYPFFLDGVALKPALQLADGMHPNAAGVAEIVRRIGPLVEQLIGAIMARRAKES